jgi:hypothetical protein
MKTVFSITRLAVYLIFLEVVVACAAPGEVDVIQTPTTILSATTTQTPIPTMTTTVTATATPTPTHTPTLMPTPTPTPTEMGGSDSIFVDVSQQIDAYNWKKLGTYRFRLSDHSFTFVAGPEYQVVGLSPDRQYLLALKDVPPSREAADLYRIRILDGKATKIVEKVFAWVGRVAYWYPNGQIAFIGWADGSKHIFVVYPDGSALTQITKNQTRPVMILPSFVETGICFASGKANITNQGTSTLIQGSWCIEFNGANLRQINDSGQAAFAPVDTSLAYPSPDDSGIEIVTSQGTYHFDIPDPTPEQVSFMTGLQWSPDGKKLLAYVVRCSPRCSNEPLILSPEGVLLDKPIDADLNDNARFIWSPDGNILLSLWSTTGSLYDLTSRETTMLDEVIPDDIFLENPIWWNSQQ